MTSSSSFVCISVGSSRDSSSTCSWSDNSPITCSSDGTASEGFFSMASFRDISSDTSSISISIRGFSGGFSAKISSYSLCSAFTSTGGDRGSSLKMCSPGSSRVSSSGISSVFGAACFSSSSFAWFSRLSNSAIISSMLFSSSLMMHPFSSFLNSVFVKPGRYS